MNGLDYLELERQARHMQGEEMRRLLALVAHWVAEGFRAVTRSLGAGHGAPGPKRLA